MTFNIPRNVPAPTSPVDKHYGVQLEGESAEEGGIVTVYDHVLIDGRRYVRSAHGADFWHLPAAAPHRARRARQDGRGRGSRDHGPSRHL